MADVEIQHKRIRRAARGGRWSDRDAKAGDAEGALLMLRRWCRQRGVDPHDYKIIVSEKHNTREYSL